MTTWSNRGRSAKTNGHQLAPAPPPPADLGRFEPYLRVVLEDEHQRLTDAPNGTRNEILNEVAFILGRLCPTYLEETWLRAQVEAWGHQVGLEPGEIRRTTHSGLTAGMADPRTIELTDQSGVVQEVDSAALLPVEVKVELDRFWDSMAVLDHLREFAYARMCSPWSLLGVTLLRVLATVPPHVVLPPLIGGPGSLNLFVALVGPSGVGKGATEAAAVDVIDFCRDIYTAPVGSGEGIAHQYAHRERSNLVRDRDAVLFSVSEIDTLTALGNRQGSTLLSQLRSAFSGERLGFGYADATRRLPIERHSYRLGLTVGVQPERAGPLLDDADGGTPQRFLWLPATDPNINAEPGREPPQWVVERVPWPGLDRQVLPVPAAASRTIREEHAKRARGGGDALDGHALFVREKVAQALCFLDQRRVMTEADWELAGVVMRVSELTRRQVVARLRQQQEHGEAARARREAARSVVVAETVSEAAIKRVAPRVLRFITERGEMPWSELRKLVTSRDREWFEEAVERLTGVGQVVVEGTLSSRRVKPAPGVAKVASGHPSVSKSEFSGIGPEK